MRHRRKDYFFMYLYLHKTFVYFYRILVCISGLRIRSIYTCIFFQKHDIPLSAIPCLQYLRALADEKTSSQESKETSEKETSEGEESQQSRPGIGMNASQVSFNIFRKSFDHVKLNLGKTRFLESSIILCSQMKSS